MNGEWRSVDLAFDLGICAGAVFRDLRRRICMCGGDGGGQTAEHMPQDSEDVRQPERRALVWERPEVEE